MRQKKNIKLMLLVYYKRSMTLKLIIQRNFNFKTMLILSMKIMTYYKQNLMKLKTMLQHYRIVFKKSKTTM